ncbi:MAG: dimethylarginine dimethylaminohydrolase [Alphaproteobacteria bacterium]|nr:dimethylarginine dimethylaminohydrolase [Alphaproteobacteria bacterium]
MRVFDFDHAIVRLPGRSVIHGLRHDTQALPDYDGVADEHRTYVSALRDAGLDVDTLPPLEDFPDSVFVEDPALVFSEGAILLRPGAASRRHEAEEMRGALRRHFHRVLELGEGACVDGGDVLVTPMSVLIGLSKRTVLEGAQALCRALAELGRQARIVETPGSVLHLKSAAALIGEDTVVTTRALEGSGMFSGFKVLLTPPGEEAAANLVRINDVVLVGSGYPRTIDMLTGHGFELRTLPVGEVAKLDAGLSCMSLRWHAARTAA